MAYMPKTALWVVKPNLRLKNITSENQADATSVNISIRHTDNVECSVFFSEPKEDLTDRYIASKKRIELFIGS